MAKKKRQKKTRKHFTGTNECLVHTSRDPPACDRGKDVCCYQKEKSLVPGPPGKPGTVQVTKPRLGGIGVQASHHVIPVSALVSYKSENAYRGYVRAINDVYWDTDYCANNPKNVKWLPKKRTYRKLSEVLKDESTKGAWDLDLPCHDWDHPKYTEEAKAEMRQRIWNKFVIPPPEGCPDPKVVEAQFGEVETYLRDELKRRGTRRGGGTRAAREHFLGKKPEPEWWMDFSMADDTQARNAPAFNFGRSVLSSLARLKKK